MLNRNENHNPFTLHEVKTLLFSIMNAIEHLHLHNVAHYDIKPANILL
jgi:serine/threonine protein kinase